LSQKLEFAGLDVTRLRKVIILMEGALYFDFIIFLITAYHLSNLLTVCLADMLLGQILVHL